MTQRSGFKVCSKLIGLVGPLKGHMALAILMGVLGNLFATFITILGIYAVLEVLGYDTPFDMSLTTIFVLAIVLAFLRALLRYAEQNRNHFIAFTLLAIIRDKVFKALRRLCPAKLEGRDKGDLISLITSDIELLEVFYAHTISPIAIAIIFSVIMVIFIGMQGVLFGVIAAVAYLVVGLVIPFLTARLSGSNAAELRATAGDLSTYVLDSLRGLQEVQQYGQGQQTIEGMESRTDTLNKLNGKMKTLGGIDTAITSSVILLFDLVMLFCTVTMCRNGDIGFDEAVLATVAMMSSFGPVVALANLGTGLQSTIAAGNRVLDILEEEPLVSDVEGKEKTEFDGAAVKDVSFSYGNEEVLSHVGLDVPKTGIVGITGPSGSGKSTLLKLLMRFWSVKNGSVEISGKNIEEVNTVDLRNMEGYVTQETVLFHDTVKNNLRIAKLDATDEEIVEACKKASVHDFIMTLPDGYDSQVGELGDTLSGGERQRLGLARAFLHDSDLVLLDEPTSNLDSLNESVILKSLDSERESKAIVIVSHRKSTLRTADEVYHMESGRVS